MTSKTLCLTTLVAFTLACQPPATEEPQDTSAPPPSSLKTRASRTTWRFVPTPS